MSRQTQLNPTEQKLYKVASCWLQRSYRLTRKLNSAQQKIKQSNKLIQNPVLNNISKYVSPTVYRFLEAQIKNFRLKPRGRRYTTEDKIFALSVYKSSPRGYRLLQKLFALPSRQSLGKLLQNITFGPGINVRIFEHLKQVVSNLQEKDRYCTVIFDEISLQVGLEYSKHKETIEGFECFGDIRRLRFANHALVFLAQGITKSWKQPLSYVFCNAATDSAQLAVLIKDIIQAVSSCGLIPVAVVCDQATNNQAAF